IGNGLGRRALRALATSLAESGTFVVNPSARTRGGVIEVVVPGVEPAEGAQLVRRRPASTDVYEMTGAELNMVLGRIRNEEIAVGADIVGVETDEADDAYEVVLTTGIGRRRPADDAALSDLYAQAGARRSMPVKLRVERQPFQVVLARVDAVPGYGWQRWQPAQSSSPVHVDGTILDNGLVRVAVSLHDGTFSVNGLAGLDRLVDDGDDGDTYNYSPPARDVIVDRPMGVDVSVVESGPVRGRLRVVRRYVWPERLVDGARVG